MFVNVKEFQTYAVHIINDVNYSDGSTHHVWIVPVQVNPLLFHSGPRYLEGDRTLQIVQDSNRTKADV